MSDAEIIQMRVWIVHGLVSLLVRDSICFRILWWCKNRATIWLDFSFVWVQLATWREWFNWFLTMMGQIFSWKNHSCLPNYYVKLHNLSHERELERQQCSGNADDYAFARLRAWLSTIFGYIDVCTRLQCSVSTLSTLSNPSLSLSAWFFGWSAMLPKLSSNSTIDAEDHLLIISNVSSL